VKAAMSPASSSTPSTAGSAATASGNCKSKTAALTGNCLVVAWDLDTTGRRLIDEICQIGAYTVLPNRQKTSQDEESSEGKKDEEETTVSVSEGRIFSQYVMPYRNPNPGARRSFGIKVVNVGRYRMLKDMATGKILKTKSEVSALQEFIDWLEEGRVKARKDGVLLACHELNRKFLVPLLLESVHKYQLFDQFQATVKGFVNGVSVVERLGSKEVITSHSLRSLCKTVLGDTNPDTNSASDRSKVLIKILAKVTSSDDQEGIDSSTMSAVTTSVDTEIGQLKDLKGMLDTQSSLRPIFEARLKQKKRAIRDRAMTLRKLVAESGLDFQAVKDAFQAGNHQREEKDVSDDTDGEKTDHAEKENSNAAEEESTSGAEDAEEVDENVELKSVLKSKIPEATDEDVDDLAEICREYFTLTNSKHKINHSDSNHVGSKTTNTFSEDCPEIKDESNDHEDAKKSKEKEPTEGADTKPAATTTKPSRGGHQSNYYNPKRGRGGYHRGSYNNSYHNQSYYGGRGGRGGGGYYQNNYRGQSNYHNGYHSSGGNRRPFKSHRGQHHLPNQQNTQNANQEVAKE